MCLLFAADGSIISMKVIYRGTEAKYYLWLGAAKYYPWHFEVKYLPVR